MSKPIFFREQKCYTLNQLSQELNLIDNYEKLKKVIGVLKRYGIIKSVQNTEYKYDDLSDLEVIAEISSDNTDVIYKFVFVGVVLVDDCVICCYPKYIKSDEDNYSEEELIDEIKLCLKVIQKYDSTKNQSIHLYNGFEDAKLFNKLAVSLYLLRDYFDNGLYSNQESIIETNGEGQIDWNRTINDTFSIIKNEKPYYLELQTLNTKTNELDYFKLLHEVIITECSKLLEDSNLSVFFDLETVKLSSQTLDDFGGIEYICYRLEKELQHQFITKKQELLKVMYTYISEHEAWQTDYSLCLYGTNAFNLVWEEATRNIFDSILKTPFKELKQVNPSTGIGSENESLYDIIEKPEWKMDNFSAVANKTLEPDIVSIHNNTFYILDAKYYCPIFDAQESKIYNQPGIQDVVKQFAYNMAFKNFIQTQNIPKTVNAFLIPTASKEYNSPGKRIGEVSLSILQNDGIPSIQIIELSHKDVFEKYLSSQKNTDLLDALKL